MFYLVRNILLTHFHVGGNEPSRRTVIFEYQDHLDEWLRGGDFPKAEVLFEARRGLGYLRYAPFYIDVLARSKRVSGCAAVRVNKRLLISREFAAQPFYSGLIEAAKEQGFAVVELPSLTTIRASLAGSKIPTPQEWEYAIRSITTKAFRRGKVGAPQLRELEVIRNLVPLGTRPVVANARIVNAFRYQGAMTHAIVRQTEKAKTRGEPNYSFEKFYPNAEDAMTAFLSTKDTANLKVLEF